MTKTINIGTQIDLQDLLQSRMLIQANSGGGNSQPVKDYCLDCKKPYLDFGLDVVLTNEQWELIHPDKYGLLCAQCIVNRAEKLGARLIKLQIIKDNL